MLSNSGSFSSFLSKVDPLLILAAFTHIHLLNGGMWVISGYKNNHQHLLRIAKGFLLSYSKYLVRSARHYHSVTIENDPKRS